MTTEQSDDLEGLFHQFAQTQSSLQSLFGLGSLLLCVLKVADSGGEPVSQPTLAPSQRLQIALLCPDWQTLMGWNIQALQQQNWLELVHPDDVFATYVKLQSLLQNSTDAPHCQFQNRMLHADGSDRLFSWRFALNEKGLLCGNATQILPEPLPLQSANAVQQMLGQLASQVTVAIQQSELYQQVSQLNATLELQVQERTAQLQQAFEFEATLKRITDKVRDSLDESLILQNAVRELTLALNISSCDTGIYSYQQNISKIAYEYVQGNVPTAHGRSVPIADFPEYYQPLLRGEHLQFCWHNAIYVAGSPIRAISNQFTVLACPIIDDQGVLGDLWLYKESDGIYEEQEIRLVQQVANQCAIAIRQARLYEAAQQQVTELERLNYLKDDFLNTISHELRTPIANIKMATELLEIHLHQLQLLGDGSSIDRHFEVLKQETQREINLINDLLDLSRVDANTEPLLLRTIDPADWLRYVVEPFIERAQIHQQTLELHIPDGAKGKVASSLPALTTDLTDLERIITELLDNACKYTPAGETIALLVRPLFGEKALQISVRNSGVEISPDEQARIFEKFYRIPNNDPWKYNGVGLGLALVQKLVQRLGAKIEIESGKGSTAFVLTVPIELEQFPR